MAEPPTYPTALGASSPATITLLGQDLAQDVMGTVGFGELAFWLATQRRPAPGEVRVFEAVLAALTDHGFTPTAIVTRLTYLSAPDSVQGALAAGLLGGGSRFLGVTEDTGKFLHGVLSSAGGELPADGAGWDALARDAVTAQRAAGRFVPGLGLPLELLRAFALLARTAGLIGLLAEELRHPVGNEIFLSVDLNNRSVPPEPDTSGGPHG